MLATWCSDVAHGDKICTLRLLVPFGITWSRPDGKRIFWGRTIVSLVAIAVLMQVAGLLTQLVTS